MLVQISPDQQRLTESTSMTTALIIGGGVAGTTAAMALRKAGLDPVVVEARQRGAADRGAFLTIMPNGMDALAAVDAYAPVEDIGRFNTFENLGYIDP